MYANGLREDSRSSFRTERMARSSDEDGYALDGEKERGPESDHVSKAAKSQRLVSAFIRRKWRSTVRKAAMRLS